MKTTTSFGGPGGQKTHTWSAPLPSGPSTETCDRDDEPHAATSTSASILPLAAPIRKPTQAYVKPIRTIRLELVPLSSRFLDALLDGSREDAESAIGLELPPDWPDRHDFGFLQLRRNQAREDPASEAWLPSAIALDGRMVGHIGFHGRPA